MQLRELKPGDTIYAVYNNNGHLYCDSIYYCTVEKVRTKDFITVITVNSGGNGIPKRAVGYYLSSCAVNECYFFCTTKAQLEYDADREKRSNEYLRLVNARDRILGFIKGDKI